MSHDARQRRKSLDATAMMQPPPVVKVLSPPMARKPIPPPKPLFLLGKVVWFDAISANRRESARH